MTNLNWLNVAALAWFVLTWVGYARFAHHKAKKKENSLSSMMNYLRRDWVREMVGREVRVGDAALIANLERNVTFLASSSMLILAGLITSFAAADQIEGLLSEIPLYAGSSLLELHLKILVLILIYVYAFFTFSWSMRQYGFATVAMGAAPPPWHLEKKRESAEEYIRAAAKVIDMAGHSYNHGLRAYYYSLAVLPWFIHPLLFMGTSTLIVVVLYRREFNSKPLVHLKIMMDNWKRVLKARD